MGSTEEHQKLVDDLLLAFGSRLDVRVWVRPVGLAYTMRGTPIKFGIPGESDIDGICSPLGRRLSIEAKTGNAVLNKKQVIFKRMVEKFGGIFIEARSVEQALSDFERKR